MALPVQLQGLKYFETLATPELLDCIVPPDARKGFLLRALMDDILAGNITWHYKEEIPFHREEHKIGKSTESDGTTFLFSGESNPSPDGSGKKVVFSGEINTNNFKQETFSLTSNKLGHSGYIDIEGIRVNDEFALMYFVGLLRNDSKNSYLKMINHPRMQDDKDFRTLPHIEATFPETGSRLQKVLSFLQQCLEKDFASAFPNGISKEAICKSVQTAFYEEIKFMTWSKINLSEFDLNDKTRVSRIDFEGKNEVTGDLLSGYASQTQTSTLRQDQNLTSSFTITTSEGELFFGSVKLPRIYWNPSLLHFVLRQLYHNRE